MKILVLTTLLSIAKCGQPPIILIPGLEESRLEAKIMPNSPVLESCPDVPVGKFFNLWFNTDLYKKSRNCFFTLMKRDWLGPGFTFPPIGLEVCPASTKDTSGVENIGGDNIAIVFRNMINYFVQRGHVTGVDIIGFPYDFRKGSSENDDEIFKLIRLIESTSKTNGGNRVVLICHSEGGLVATKLMHSVPQVWKDRYIKKVISLAGAFGGSTTIVASVLSNSKKYLIPSNFNLTLAELHHLFMDTTGMYWLFPDERVFPINQVLVSTPQRNYTAVDLHQMLKDAGNTQGASHFSLQERILSNPGVPWDCIYSKGIPTLNKFTYTAMNDFPLEPSSAGFGDGDGNLNLVSAEVCKRWMGKSNRVTSKIYSKLSHIDLVTSLTSIQYVYERATA